MVQCRLLLLRTETVTFALKFLLLRILFVLLGGAILGPNTSIEFQLEDVVIIVGHASNVLAKDVRWWIELGGVFDLLSIKPRSFAFECVESIVVVDELSWIDFHLLFDTRFSLRLFVADWSIEFHLKKIRHVSAIAQLQKICKLTFISHSIIVTALPGFVSNTHSS